MVGSPSFGFAVDLLQRHADLEATHGDGDGGSFLSGWQCENPWKIEISQRIAAERNLIDDSKYLYLEDDETISHRLAEFHTATDGAEPLALLCGAGSSPLIFTFCAYLKEIGVREVYFVPPLYFSTHAAFRTFGIRARPISGRQAYEPEFTVNWPSEECVLFLCDPIWYAGLHVPHAVIDELVAWQQRTNAMVFVDGSFQYMRWDETEVETTTRLAPDRTVRLICPTKILALHGYRCAHAIMPQWLREQFSLIYTRIYGSTSVDNIAFGRAAALMLRERTIGTALMRSVAARHRDLRDAGVISAPWEPDCGYFVFEQLRPALADARLLMDGSFFEQKRFPDFRRLNLLSPQIGVLG